MYKSYISPVFDYCSTIWANCSKQQELSLEKLHLDALRTICGAVRGTSHEKLYAETSSKPLSKRREYLQLTVFYKMINNLTPQYLSNLVPQQTGNVSNYCLRNQTKLQSIRCKTDLYARSFLPHTSKLWNDLPNEICNADTITAFKRLLNQNNQYSPKYFDLNFGSRSNQILHCRLRLGCSDLNAEKYHRFISDDPTCSCGHILEDSLHYFFYCRNFTVIRNNSFFYTKGHDLNTVLYGNELETKETNHRILQSVHAFILHSKRFN